MNCTWVEWGVRHEDVAAGQVGVRGFCVAFAPRRCALRGAATAADGAERAGAREDGAGTARTRAHGRDDTGAIRPQRGGGRPPQRDSPGIRGAAPAGRTSGAGHETPRRGSDARRWAGPSRGGGVAGAHVRAARPRSRAIPGGARGTARGYHPRTGLTAPAPTRASRSALSGASGVSQDVGTAGDAAAVAAMGYRGVASVRSEVDKHWVDLPGPSCHCSGVSQRNVDVGRGVSQAQLIRRTTRSEALHARSCPYALFCCPP